MAVQHFGDDYRIVVMRALGGLGDTLCCIPALRLLRSSFPEAHITYLGLDQVFTLLHRFSDYYDTTATFPGWPGIAELSSHVDAEEVDACRGADLMIQMHGDGTSSNGFCSSLEPKAFVTHGPVVSCAGCEISTRIFDASENEVVRSVRLVDRAVRFVGATPPAATFDLEFPLLPADVAAAERCRERLRFADSAYAIVHPGASSDDRRWPAERFAEVGKALQRRGLIPVITGSHEERALGWQVSRLIGKGAIVAAGELTLGGMGALLATSAGVITNDTGISHLAAAVKAPSVVVFTGSNPKRWAPLDDSLSHTLRPSATTTTAAGDRILESPSVEEALSAVASLDFTA